MLVGAATAVAAGGYEQAVRLGLTFVIVLIPRLLDVPRPFDLAFLCGMSFQAWGNVLGLFNAFSDYDKIVHFVLPCGTAALLYLALVRLEVVPDLAQEAHLHRRIAMVTTTFAFGLAVGGIYELYEWFADMVLGGHLHVGYADTIGDLADDAAGSLLGGALLVLWSQAGWGTRRIPGRTGSRRRDPLAGIGRRVVTNLRPRRAAPPRVKRAAPTWAPLLTTLADLVRVSLITGCVVALTQLRYEQAVRFALTLLACLAPRVLRTPRLFDLGFTAAMAGQAWGDVAGAFSTVTGYDIGVRLVVSSAAAAILYLVLIRISAVPDFSHESGIRQRLAIGLTGFSFGFGAGIFYELYVWMADSILGARIPVDYRSLIGRLSLDALGALIGGLLLVLWDQRGWDSRVGTQPR